MSLIAAEGITLPITHVMAGIQYRPVSIQIQIVPRTTITIIKQSIIVPDRMYVREADVFLGVQLLLAVLGRFRAIPVITIIHIAIVPIPVLVLVFSIPHRHNTGQ